MQPSSIQCKSSILDLSTPQVMGIINVTPDSFSKVGRFITAHEAVQHAEQLVAEGAAVIDVGGESTRPGATSEVTTLQQELDRVIPVIEKIATLVDVPISIDTSQPEVMYAAVHAGASFINDVRALTREGAVQAAAELNVPVCIMHMTSLGSPLENDPLAAIIKFLQQRIDACLQAGIAKQNIVVDPGMGHGIFGKNLDQNLAILARLDELHTLGVPVLVGASRKTFIGELLDLPVGERLSASLAAAVLAVCRGAHIIRVHDVKATVHALKLTRAVNKQQKKAT